MRTRTELMPFEEKMFRMCIASTLAAKDMEMFARLISTIALVITDKVSNDAALTVMEQATNMLLSFADLARDHCMNITEKHTGPVPDDLKLRTVGIDFEELCKKMEPTAIEAINEIMRGGKS